MSGKYDSEKDDFLDAFEKSNVKITFGLQPYHVEAIEKELQRWRDMPPLASFPDQKVNPLYIKYVWEKLGKELGWEAFTLCLYYFEYLEDQKLK